MCKCDLRSWRGGASLRFVWTSSRSFKDHLVEHLALQSPKPETAPTEVFLELHLDVNKTVIMTDAMQGLGSAEVAAQILADTSFGAVDGSVFQLAASI